MKNLTIRAKITIWFIIFFVVILGLSFTLFFASWESVQRDMIRSDLQETVNSDMQAVTYHPGKELPVPVAGKIYVEYKDGYVKIDDNFMKLTGGIGVGLYDTDGTMIYGENLIPKESHSVPFEDEKVQTIQSGPDMFYVYDQLLKTKKGEKFWVRGSVDREQRLEEFLTLLRSVLFLLPFLILLAAAGGYLITRKSLKPIRSLIKAADNVSSGSDLKQRIDIGEGENEVQHLARSFNDMMQRLDESFESEKEFTSNVSHELRTPMAAIMAQCELALEEEQLTDQEARDALAVIQRQGGRMNDMINDMLTYTRIDRHHDHYPFALVNLSNLTNETCNDFIAAHGLEGRLHVQTEDHITLDGSAQLLQRMLNNLLENADRYGGEQGDIEVQLTKDAEQGILLRVTDHGIGIAPEQIERIFDRFYQVDSARSGEGTGLGLSMVREIAEIHGGSVCVESVPGEGSTFTVRL